MKTKDFDIEGALIKEEAPLTRLAMATLVAAVTIQQLVHARDGLQGPNPLRPMTDAFEAEDQPLLEAFTAKLEGKTLPQKNHPEGLPRLRRLDLRQPRRMDRILRKTRAHRHSQRLAILPSGKTWRRCHGGSSRCVYPVAAKSG